jgi:hypothetical protein
LILALPSSESDICQERKWAALTRTAAAIATLQFEEKIRARTAQLHKWTVELAATTAGLNHP